MSKIDFNLLRDRVYKCACEHGFHDTELSNEHLLMLVITELSEAVEADRKGKVAQRRMFEMNCDTPQEDPIHHWMFCFDRLIKDSVPDELADAVIRLLDLAGLRKIDMNDRFNIAYVVSYNKSFIENCYAIIKDIVNYRYSFEECLNYALRQIFELAKYYDIDLLWHIEQKMRYNELRPAMHGKKY